MKKLSAPATEEEVGDFAEACRKVEVEPADTLRKIARAFVLHVEKHKQVVFPIRLADRSPAEKKQSRR